MYTGHNYSFAAEHDVLFAFNEGSARNFVAGILEYLFNTML